MYYLRFLTVSTIHLKVHCGPQEKRLSVPALKHSRRNTCKIDLSSESFNEIDNRKAETFVVKNKELEF